MRHRMFLWTAKSIEEGDRQEVHEVERKIILSVLERTAGT